jgi:hypothetical protein
MPYASVSEGYLRIAIGLGLLLASCGKPEGPNVTDGDEDGYVAAVDCVDDDPDVFPGNDEVPNNDKDDDCDPATFDDDADLDGVPTDEDCDDEAAWMGQGSTVKTAEELAVRNAAEAEAFCDGYCRVSVTGKLVLLGVDKLEYLACLADVEELEIRGTAAPTLEAFTRLERVGSLTISEATALQDLTGLEPITELGDLTVQDSPKLRMLKGIGVRELGRLTVQGMPAMRSLRGLGTVRELGALVVRDNPQLENLEGLEKVTSVAMGFELADNAALTSVAEMELLETVGGDLTITGNTSLPSADLSAWLAGVTVEGTSTVENNGP